jgi:hypothetical protein
MFQQHASEPNAALAGSMCINWLKSFAKRIKSISPHGLERSGTFRDAWERHLTLRLTDGDESRN